MNNFERAFAAARKAGKKEFTWSGKKYNTKLADDSKKAPKFKTTPKTAPIPEPRPFRGTTTTSRNTPIPPEISTPQPSTPKTNIPKASTSKVITPPVAAGYRKAGARVNFLPNTQIDKLAPRAAPAKEESWRDKFKKQNQAIGLRKKYERSK